VGRNQRRLDVAKSLGADYVVNTREKDLTSFVKDMTSDLGVDTVIDNVGTSESVTQGISSIKPGGRIVMVGETDNTLPISTFQICTNEYEIVGSRSGGRQDTVEAIKLVEEGAVTPFISDRFPLEQVNQAFDRVRSGEVLGRAVVTNY
jgi:propanol-preferring alcohol dehydrogenase